MVVCKLVRKLFKIVNGKRADELHNPILAPPPSHPFHPRQAWPDSTFRHGDLSPIIRRSFVLKFPCRVHARYALDPPMPWKQYPETCPLLRALLRLVSR